MALKAYEDACIRAELFGQPIPDKDEFLTKHKHLDIVEFEEVEIKSAAENTAMLGDDLNTARGGLNELNTILSSTQSKLNKIKGVCGSLTNFFRGKLQTRDNLSYSSEPSYVGQTNYDKDYVPSSYSPNARGKCDGGETASAGNTKHNGGDINSALQVLEAMEDNENVSLVVTASKDVSKQITSQVSKLDQLISQADRAQSSLHHQNKQIRSFLR